ncbi:hypothetical protein [Alienimonas sp. DA493]
MTPLDLLTGAAEALSWYAAAVLPTLGDAAFVACPWVRDTDAWERLVR